MPSSSLLLILLVLLFLPPLLISTSTTTAKADRETAGRRREPDPDDKLDCVEIVKRYGYDVEQHFVQTEDGYVLTMYHVRGKKSVVALGGEARPARTPVLMMHGLLDSGIVFVQNGLRGSLAFALLETGRYDVWIGNNRGNAESLRHMRYRRVDQAFWEFSFDEMARFDVIAMLDYVASATQHERVTYVGHSQGVMQVFAGLGLDSSLRARIRNRLEMLVGICPVAYIHNMKSFAMRSMAELDLDELTARFGVKSFPPAERVFETVFPELCRDTPNASFCTNLLESVYGVSNHLNTSREEVFLSQFPAGSSMKNVKHFAQLTRVDRFGRFDYGPDRNLKEYGSRHSPDYDLSAFPRDLPTVLFYGTDDALVAPEDLDHLRRRLPDEGESKIRFERVEGYSHVDFVWGKDNDVLFIPRLLRALAGGDSSSMDVHDTLALTTALTTASCETLKSPQACHAITGCVWCVSYAVPSGCYAEDKAKELPYPVFVCDQPEPRWVRRQYLRLK